MTNVIQQRVAALVRDYYQGSVNQAAEAIGVPQTTLNRLVSGRTPNPRSALLQRIANKAKVPIGWLLGDGPDDPPKEQVQVAGPDRVVRERISGSLLRWRSTLEQLMRAEDGLSDLEAEALSQVTLGPAVAASFLAEHVRAARTLNENDGIGGPALLPTEIGDRATESVRDGWQVFLDGIVRQYSARLGVIFVRQYLAHFLLGFTPGAVFSLTGPGGDETAARALARWDETAATRKAERDRAWEQAKPAAFEAMREAKGFGDAYREFDTAKTAADHSGGMVAVLGGHPYRSQDTANAGPVKQPKKARGQKKRR